MEDVVGVAQCGDQLAATDPGSWTLGSRRESWRRTSTPTNRSTGPDTPCTSRRILRWRQMDALVPFDRPEAEVVVSDTNDKVVFRRQVKLDGFGAVQASFPVPSTAALGNYTIRIQSGDAQGSGGFEVQEYRKPEFEVIVTPASRFVVQGREAVVDVQARYYFGQPVANGQLRWVVNQQPYFSPLRWNDDVEGGDSSYWYGDNQTAEGTLRLDADGKAQIRIPLGVDENGRDFSARIEAQVTDAANREVSGRTIVHATFGTFFALRRGRQRDSSRRRTIARYRFARSTISARRKPNVPVTLSTRAPAISIRATTANPRSRRSRTQNSDHRRQRPRDCVTLTLPNRTGSFRVRAHGTERRSHRQD